MLLLAITLKAQDYVRPAGSSSSPTPTGPTSAPTSNENKKFIIDITMGPAIPLSDYARTNVKNCFWDFTSVDSTHLQGFAKTGFNFNITAAYLFSEYFGIKLTLSYSSNLFDVNTFSATIAHPAYTSTQTNYHAAEYMIGPYMSMPLSSKLRLNASASIGLVSLGYPEIIVAVNDTVTDTFDFQGGSGFGYCLDAGLEYKISPGIGLLFNIAYSATTISYNGFQETLNTAGYYPYIVDHSTDTPYMTTSILKPTIGIVFKL